MINPYQGYVNLIKNSFYTKECTDKEYFEDTEKISNSALGLLNFKQKGSPQKFIDGFKDNKKSYFELGSAIHKMILEGDIYTVSNVEKPSGKIGDIIDSIHELQLESAISLDDAMTQACIINDYYNGKPGEKRIAEIWKKGMEYLEFLKTKDESDIILTSAMKSKLDSCCNSIKLSKSCIDSLYPKGQDVFREYPIFGDASVKLTKYDDELDYTEEKDVVIPLKGKIDLFSIDHINMTVNLTDLKTTGKPVQTFMGYYDRVFDGQRYVSTYVPGSFHIYRYYRQMAFYGDMLMTHLINTNIINEKYKLKVRMVVVETNNPFGCLVYEVDKYSMREGRSEYKDLLKMLAYYKLNGFDKIIAENDIRREEEDL